MTRRDAVIGRKRMPAKWPLAPFVRKYAAYLPLIAALGLFASLLEGAGIGLLIPLLSSLLSSAAPPSLPEPLEAVSAWVAPYDPETRILLFGGVIVGLIAFKSLVQAANACLATFIDGNMSNDMREAIGRRLLSLDYAFFLKEDQARLSRIFANDSWFVSEAVRWALSLIPAAATVAVFCALLAWINITLFAIVIAGAAVVQLVMSLFERKQRMLSESVLASSHKMWTRMMMIVNGERVIRIFGREPLEQEKFAETADGFRRAFARSRFVSAFSAPTIETVIALLFIAIVIVGYRTGITVPVITAFLLLLSRLQPAAAAIRTARTGIASVRGSIREVEWLLAQQPSGPGAQVEPLNAFSIDRAITFEGVSFHYSNGAKAVEDASFTILPGVATALVGKSGSGKTTIVNLICRLLQSQAGSILHGETPIESIDLASWRSRIAVAGQDLDLVEGSIAENIAYGRPDASRDEIEDVANAVGAARFIAALPDGYESQVGQDGLKLSGGQRQRIGLARALLRRPDLLILDEATNAIDAMSETETIRLLSQHRYFRTALVISHRKSTLAACGQGIVIADGKVCESGPLASLGYFRSMAGIADAAA